MTKYFEEIEDRRQQWKIRYLLVEVIVMTIISDGRNRQLEQNSNVL